MHKHEFDQLILPLCLLGGIYVIVVALFFPDRIYNDNRGRVATAWFGKTGARIFYALLGLALIVVVSYKEAFKRHM